ncbi:MAG: DNA mismatch repair protein MutS [Clostridiales bacterium]|jgi:DNA mismatch repair protein MutS|nr:DNA mismatch repair protein MutS [Clostridiales bacterium]
MGRYSPMMEQYWRIKKQYSDCLIFFRLGDFYELFFDDAPIASEVLDIALTARDCGMDERAPMCGVPVHSMSSYLTKLVESGHKVAVAEQMEDPKLVKGLVKREVIRVVTPGTLIDGAIEGGRNKFICCVYQGKQHLGLAAADITTGEFSAASFPADGMKEVCDEIARFQPAELIVNEGFSESGAIESLFGLKPSVYASSAFSTANAYQALINHFHTINLQGFGIERSDPEVNAAGALFTYLTETQKNDLSHITLLRKQRNSKYMLLDVSSRRNLELTETLNGRQKKNSLLNALDRTKTAMGARSLRKWIEQPLTDIGEINRRLDAVEAFKENMYSREELRGLLSRVLDIERIMARVIYQTANSRDLLALKNSFQVLPLLSNLLVDFPAPLVQEIQTNFDTLNDICQLIDATIADAPPVSVREGGFIKDGCNQTLDDLRKAKDGGSEWLKEYELKEREQTGIRKLKVSYNRVFGYYIEISNANRVSLPDRYIRRQTLANCERYVTSELKKIEDMILGADEKIVTLEYELFVSLRGMVAAEVTRIQLTSSMIAAVDALQALGDAADHFRYVKPEMVSDGSIVISGGRHPVIEQITDMFVPNDALLDLRDNQLAIITGPNMAGKSTYMRQTALIVLMAQAGSFVPANGARISVADRIFTRVGASDDLATGQSTFMVEMSEVANILNNATENSLLILDEIGRGTSTFDGLSIAWSVLEYISGKIGAKTLFATHYHELTELEGKLPGVKNYRVGVKEEGEDIIFLRKIMRGGADHSYGIQVARLAGLPADVLERSREIYDELNNADITHKASPAEAVTRIRSRRRKRETPDSQISMRELFEL